ncbi:hypothetical protein C8R46DRAFT_1103009 [Mycena filopes]|nr:hypothetical protein C8R46DRAFT_1103009 [Mycena filopes]
MDDDDDDTQPSTPHVPSPPPSSSRNSRRTRQQGPRTASGSTSTPRVPRHPAEPRPSTRTRGRAAANGDSSRENTPTITPPLSPLRGRRNTIRFGHGRDSSPQSPSLSCFDHFPSEWESEEFPYDLNQEVTYSKSTSPVKLQKQQTQKQQDLADWKKRQRERRKNPKLRPKFRLEDVVEITDSDEDQQPSPPRPSPRKRKRPQPKDTPRKKARPQEVIEVLNTSEEEAEKRPAPRTHLPVSTFSDVEEIVMGGTAAEVNDTPIFDDLADDEPVDLFVGNNGEDGVFDFTVEDHGPAVPDAVVIEPAGDTVSVGGQLLASAAEVEEGPVTKQQYDDALFFDQALAAVEQLDTHNGIPTATPAASQTESIEPPPAPNVVPSLPPASVTTDSPSSAPDPRTSTPTESSSLLPENPTPSRPGISQPVSAPTISTAVRHQSPAVTPSDSTTSPTPTSPNVTTTQTDLTPGVVVASTPPRAESNTNSTTAPSAPPARPAAAQSSTLSAAPGRRSLVPPRSTPTPTWLTLPSSQTSSSQSSRRPPLRQHSTSVWDGQSFPSNYTTLDRIYIFSRRDAGPARAASAPRQQKVQETIIANTKASTSVGYTPPPLSPTSDSTLGGTPPMGSVVPLALTLTCVPSDEGMMLKHVEVGSGMVGANEGDGAEDEEVDQLADDLELDMDLALGYPPTP